MTTPIDLLRAHGAILQATAHAATTRDVAVCLFDTNDAHGRALADRFAAELRLKLPAATAGDVATLHVAIPRKSLAHMLRFLGYDRLAAEARNRLPDGYVFAACWSSGECFLTDMEIGATPARGQA